MIAAKQTLQLGKIIKSNELEVISGTIKLEVSNKMHICSYYRPPNRTDYAYNTLAEEIANLRTKAKTYILLVF